MLFCRGKSGEWGGKHGADRDSSFAVTTFPPSIFYNWTSEKKEIGFRWLLDKHLGIRKRYAKDMFQMLLYSFNELFPRVSPNYREHITS